LHFKDKFLLNKYIKMKKVASYILSIISIIKIFCITKGTNKKNLLFYFPVKIYQENIFDLIKILKKKYNVILIYNLSSKSLIKDCDNSYFYDFAYSKFIPFQKKFLSKIDVFVSSYLSYVYPPNSKNIYMSHDIYDAPMINKKFEKALFLRIGMLDYIFCSSKISEDYLKGKLDKLAKNSNTIIVNTGYLKLDHNLNKIKKNNKSKSILIAPGYSLNYIKYNMYKFLERIISEILNKTDKIVIFRPHPLDLTSKGNQPLINKIILKFKNNKKFITNLTPSYIKEFQNSEILITDLTSTAYTYAFSTLKPVIFFSNNESYIFKNKNFNQKFFIDRHKIGSIVLNVNMMMHQINFLIKNKNFYANKIRKLRKKRIQHLNTSLRTTRDALYSILND